VVPVDEIGIAVFESTGNAYDGVGAAGGRSAFDHVA